MYRIDNTNSVGSAPTPPAAGTEGYFTEAAPATPVPDWWLNMVQEELRNIATLKSATTSKTSLDQCKTAVEMAVNAVVSATSDTTSSSTVWKKAVIASHDSQASGASCSGVVAGDGVHASGNRAAVLSSYSQTTGKVLASGAQSFVAACTGYNTTDALEASGGNSAIIASHDAASKKITATGFNTFIAACSVEHLNTVAQAEGAAIIACKDAATCNGTYSLTAASNQANAGTDGDWSAVLASNTVYTNANYSMVAASYGTSYTQDPALYSAVIASNASHTENTRSAVIASNTSECNGTDSIAAASATSHADAQYNAIIASTACQTLATSSGILSSSTAYTRTGSNSLLVSSQKCQLGSAFSLGLGYATTGSYVPIGTGDHNLTIRLDGQNGDGYWDNNLNSGNADYAEYFENKKKGVLPVGSVVAFDGDKVRLSKTGDQFVRVVSAAPCLVGNSASLGWGSPYKRDDFGAYLMTDHSMVKWDGFDGLVSEAGPKKDWPKDAEEYVMRWRVESEDYDPTKEYTPRGQRPEEWTIVGLLGQLMTRVDDTVSAGDFVGGGAKGIGTKAAQGLRCMAITSPYDAARGYAIAKVLAI